MKTTPIILAALLFSGCASTPDGPCEDGHPQLIRIESSHPARIEFGNEYVGDAPGDFFVCVDDDGEMDGYLFITAIPTVEGQSPQVKYIQDGERPPRRIFFEMSLARRPTEFDINIR